MMAWLRALLHRPPPAPDIEPTLAQLRASRAVLAEHADRRHRDAVDMRLEQTRLRRRLRTNPLADDLFGEVPR